MADVDNFGGRCLNYADASVASTLFLQGQPGRQGQQRTNPDMDSTLTAEASVSADGKLVAFVVFARGHVVQCSITRDALEQHFWAPIGADDARLLKAYTDGHKRIAAAVERKVLRGSAKPITLHAADFSH
ncbi:DUF1488 family protein [Paraburkholderia sp. DGU8]|jgi:hypothetical protein|uniref:DUF1488 family protein n=1 Tax=Paraburkholderia sp. DGU8 TaxID=3161997 RepID=UPI0034678C24